MSARPRPLAGRRWRLSKGRATISAAMPQGDRRIDLLRMLSHIFSRKVWIENRLTREV